MIARARERRRGGRPTIFFLDEIHRFNKAQQDALLPAVEEGLVTLVGATTENPYFEVNSALLSPHAGLRAARARAPPTSRACCGARSTRGECGGVAVDDDAVAFLAARSGGDARAALNALELACETVARAGDGDARVTVADAEDAMQRKAVLYDKDGDQHYDFISAWIKSTRGSDPDASLYYLAAMLEGGEDPRYIARRMIVLASEDVGNADPQALPLAIAAAHAVEHVGFPECQFALAQAAIYLSLAPKSNAAKRAILAARAHIAERRRRAARRARCARRRSRRRAAPGRGVGYENPHDEPGHVNDQEHLPAGLEGLRFYAPDDAEAALRERLAELRRARGREP